MIRILALAAAASLLASPAFAQTTATSPAPHAMGSMKPAMKGGAMNHNMKNAHTKGGSMSHSMKHSKTMASPAPKAT